MDIVGYNSSAWDHQVKQANRWTVPVSSAEIAAAKRGDWNIVLTPSKPVPMQWFPQQMGLFPATKILALASGGGQQVPILAAAGAEVTVFDNSQLQLQQDIDVAQRENLKIKTVQGDMRDLGVFNDQSFDLIFHPCSNSFVPDINPVWRECFRVLKPGGILMSGIVNPIVYAVDPDLDTKGTAVLKYKIPYSDLTSLNEEERRRYTDKNDPLCFGHTLDDQLGGQLRAGFYMTHFFEDNWGPDAEEKSGALNKLMSCFIATRVIKPK